MSPTPTPKTWKIIFRGEVLPGLNRESVQKDCVIQLKLSPEKVERMFSGSQITLRKNLNSERLDKYVIFFQRCGLRVHVVEEKDKLTLIDERPAPQQRATFASNIANDALHRQAMAPESADEIFGQQTIMSPLLGQNNFYDALIRTNEPGADAVFHERSLSSNSGSRVQSDGTATPRSNFCKKPSQPSQKINPILIIGGALGAALLVTILYVVLF